MLATQELHNQGGIQSLSKCFFSSDKQIKKTALEILALLNLTDEATEELADLGMISLTLKMMH